MFKTSQMKVALSMTILFCNTAYAQEARETHNSLDLSQEALMLLQAEMRELAVASQGLVISLVSGDWKSIGRTSERIRASYVMEQNLTVAQRQELADKLPERFKHLDLEFHVRAEKLGAAAADENAELVAFHYYRLLESCVTCHSEFAASRFPGLESSATGPREH